MKYQCKAGHVFIHPLVIVRNDFNRHPYAEAKDEMFLHSGDLMVVASKTIHVCPMCEMQNLATKYEYDEIVEPKEEITSLLDIEPKQFDEYSAKGYVLMEGWKDKVRVVKKGAK